ncbi:hypothetical protein [Sphingomonas montanisoli]|uniref:Uncharacterized protein n=1 Tax=Sphingomonas montanisoli TaxID=2606412 RepID=A0A5D9C2I3_9SPHN|nr:hypothetical protein [Sphingomonas montanisoli]TZG25633.1 hypothetical protein FYJ91_11445 [Sphingomonas montanisoli]
MGVPDIRSPLEMVMFAAWVNVPVDQVPASYRAPACADTMAAWKRVGEAALAYHREHEATPDLPERGGWRSIASAPKGREVLVWPGFCDDVTEAILGDAGWQIATMNGQTMTGNPEMWMPKPLPPGCTTPAPAGELEEMARALLAKVLTEEGMELAGADMANGYPEADTPTYLALRAVTEALRTYPGATTKGGSSNVSL